MKVIKNTIERIFTKKNIKIFLLLFVVMQFFIWTSFAASSGGSSSDFIKNMSHLLHVFISILSWVWVLLATMAWKLMTNDFVYWSFMHLDKSLWDLWNIMKNFANFTLWFILVFTIVKNLFKWSFGDSSADPLKGAKDTIIHTLIAWVLIQMSWFLMAAVLDLSTIATAAVWSIPAQFMSNTPDFQTKMTAMIEKSTTKLKIDFSSNSNTVQSMIWIDEEHNTTEEIQKLFDTITPSADSLAWPLMFLWASVFNLYDLSDTSKNESGTADLWDLILSLWINWFVLFSYSLMLALIFVFNLFRVITLWIVIPLMPFVVLVGVFSKWQNAKITWFLKDVLDYKKILKLVFKPVYMTLVLSIILIVMVLVRSLAKANGGFIDMQQEGNMTISSSQDSSGYYDSSLSVAGIANVKLHMKESIVDLIVYIFWLALMFMLMKSCMSGEITWIKFVDDKIGKLSESLWWEKWKLWWLIWSAWIIPIWGGKKVWISKMTEFKDMFLGDWRRWANAMWIDMSKQDAAVEWLLWWSTSFASLNTGMSKDAWIKKAVELWKSNGYTDAGDMYNRNNEFKKAFNTWHNEYKWRSDDISIQDIDDAWNKKDESQWWDDSTP